MSRVRSRDTGPELLVRKLLSKSGVRYRLHKSQLPGQPDVYIGRLRLAIFVNGCFWHGHDCHRGGRPKTNADFWNDKIGRNIERDRMVLGKLQQMGIETLVLWTCEAESFSAVCRRLSRRYKQALP